MIPKQYFWRFWAYYSACFLSSYPFEPLMILLMSFSQLVVYYSNILSKSLRVGLATSAAISSAETISWYFLGTVVFLPIREVTFAQLSLLEIFCMHFLISTSKQSSFPLCGLYSLLISQQPSNNSIRPRMFSFLNNSTSQVYCGSDCQACKDTASRSANVIMVSKRRMSNLPSIQYIILNQMNEERGENKRQRNSIQETRIKLLSGFQESCVDDKRSSDSFGSNERENVIMHQQFQEEVYADLKQEIQHIEELIQFQKSVKDFLLGELGKQSKLTAKPEKVIQAASQYLNSAVQYAQDVMKLQEELAE